MARLLGKVQDEILLEEVHGGAKTYGAKKVRRNEANWNREHVIAIDPGVCCGVAVFESRSKKLVAASTFEPSREGGDWDVRCNSTIFEVCMWLQSLRIGVAGYFNFRQCYIEYPCFMESRGGKASARRGDLIKLAYMAGRLHQRMDGMTGGQGVGVVRVPVNEWKGQLSKENVVKRLRRILTQDEIRDARLSVEGSHDWDAVGIGVWATQRSKI